MGGLSVYLSFTQRDNPVLNTEIWKEINELPYEISNLGTVRRKSDAAYYYRNRTHIKPYVNNKGYLCVNLYKNSKMYKFQVHRLIAINFIPNPNNLPEVNHIDGVKLNNSIGNLEWCTHQQNTQHAWDTGLHTIRNGTASSKRQGSTSVYRGVSWSEQRKRWCVYITVDKKHYGVGRFKNEIEAAKAYDAFLINNSLLEKGYKLNFS